MNIINDELRQQLNQNQRLAEELAILHGNVVPDLIDEMIETLGENFEVWIKPYSGDRRSITLDALKYLEDTDPELFDNIREVFIEATEYRELFETA